MQGSGGGGEQQAPPPDSGAACLVLIARFFELPGDLEQLRHRYAPDGAAMAADDIVRAAKGLGLKSRAVSTSWERLADMALPAIAEGRDGGFFVIARCDGTKALIQDPAQGRPEVLEREALAARWSGRLVLCARRAAPFGKGSRFDLSWFVPAILRYRGLFSEVLVASFFLQLFALATPLFFQVVVDKVLVHKGLTTLDVLVIALVVVTVFEAVLGYLRTYLFAHTALRVDVELGAKTFDHLARLPLAYFQARRTGDSVARVRELETVREFLTGSALTLTIDLFFVVVFFAVMWWYSPLLTGIVLGSIPFYVLLAIFVTPVLRRRLDEKFRRGADNQAFLVESVGGIETLKAMAVEPQAQRRWEEQLAAYVQSSFSATNLGNFASQATQLISKLTLALTLYFGAKLVIEGGLTVGQLVAFNMLSGRVTGPILRMAQLWQDFQQARIAVDRLGDILNTPTEPAFNPARTTLKRIGGRVVLDDVTFRYRPDGPEILRRVSLDIPAGSVVGIVGASGSGKSTLAKLVQRMYAPESGRVLVDGVDLSMVDTAWLRSQVGVVLQENVLFNRSVRDNIALADPALPMERIVAAAEMAGAQDFILQLAEGYDTELGERGSTLSGGQRQRIAIARALVTDPRILIFDEATSALDYESERAIQENMAEICRDRTVLIIAHRLSTVRHANRIVVMDGGTVSEEGTHDELLRLRGRYARLWALQSGDLADAAE